MLYFPAVGMLLEGFIPCLEERKSVFTIPGVFAPQENPAADLLMTQEVIFTSLELRSCRLSESWSTFGSVYFSFSLVTTKDSKTHASHVVDSSSYNPSLRYF